MLTLYLQKININIEAGEGTVACNVSINKSVERIRIKKYSHNTDNSNAV